MKSGELFCVTTPSRCTASGSRGVAAETRFCTSTWAWSGSVPRAKTTLIVTVPLETDWLRM